MFLSVISWLGRACAQGDQQLHFSFFTSFGGGFISSGSVPAVGLALQQVAGQAVLPGYTLNYVLRDSGVYYIYVFCDQSVMHLQEMTKYVIISASHFDH